MDDTERDYDRLSEAQQVKQELGEMERLQAENERLAELVQVQRAYIRLIELSPCQIPDGCEENYENRTKELRKKIRELEGV